MIVITVTLQNSGNSGKSTLDQVTLSFGMSLVTQVYIFSNAAGTLENYVAGIYWIPMVMQIVVLWNRVDGGALYC